MTKIKIMLDPGHGGKDPGAIGNGLKEKDLVLTIARHIRNAFQQHDDVLVRMTRSDDTYLTLEERARMANEWGADVFLSIHINAGGGTGFESFIHPSGNAHTLQYQQAIHSEIITRVDTRDRGMKQGNFAVLRLTKMPALLTENLFIDNKSDAEKLRDPMTLQRIAQGHVNGLRRALKLRPLKEEETVPAKRRENSLYRVRVNGKQIGAFGEPAHVLKQVGDHIGKASRIELERV